MKNIMTLAIGGTLTLCFAPIIGYVVTLAGTAIMLVGKYLSSFPGIL